MVEGLSCSFDASMLMLSLVTTEVQAVDFLTEELVAAQPTACSLSVLHPGVVRFVANAASS